MSEPISIPSFVGSRLARIAALFIGGFFGLALFLNRFILENHLPLRLFFFLGLFSLFGIILSSRKLFKAWTEFGNLIQKVVTSLLFGAVYLIIIPIFRIPSWIGQIVQREKTENTFWIKRSVQKIDRDFFKRLG